MPPSRPVAGRCPEMSHRRRMRDEGTVASASAPSAVIPYRASNQPSIWPACSTSWTQASFPPCGARPLRAWTTATIPSSWWFLSDLSGADHPVKTVWSRSRRGYGASRVEESRKDARPRSAICSKRPFRHEPIGAASCIPTLRPATDILRGEGLVKTNLAILMNFGPQPLGKSHVRL